MKISVIIPTYNGFETLRELFAVLHFQTAEFHEILVVDSSSTDGTVELCREHGATVEVIPQAEYDHGGTRTRMAERAEGDVLVFFTQDAIPTTRDAVELLLKPLQEDPVVAVSYGRQLPNKDCGFAASHLRRFNYPDQSCVRTWEDRKEIGIKTIFTSNSFAAYRREDLASVGFFQDGLIFGEDTCAVARLLKGGKKVAYVSEACVYHSHDYDLAEEFRRSFDIGVLHSSEAEIFTEVGKAEGRGAEYVRSGIGLLWSKREYVEMGDFILRSMLKLIGYKLGRRYMKIPTSWVKNLSMHRVWWDKR